MSELAIRLDAVPALLNRERAAIAAITDPKDMADTERRLAAIADLTKRAGLAVPIQNEATFLRAEALARLAELVDAGQEAGEINRPHRPSKVSESRPVPVPRQRIAEGRALARSDVIEKAREQAVKKPDEPISMASMLKQAQRRERDTALKVERQRVEAEARASGLTHSVQAEDLRMWRPEGVDAIVTDPPYITDDAVELHSALADFALDVLPEGGPLIVMTWQAILADVIEAMRRPNLAYRWCVAWTYETNERTPDRARRVFDGWKPVLVFHKGAMPVDATYIYDLVRSENLDKGSHEWGQSISGFRRLVRAASEPGQTICDPFVGGGTTAVAALAEGRHFKGCDIDQQAVATTLERLAA